MGGCCTRIAELRQDAKLRMLALDTRGRLCQPVAERTGLRVVLVRIQFAPASRHQLPSLLPGSPPGSRHHRQPRVGARSDAQTRRARRGFRGANQDKEKRRSMEGRGCGSRPREGRTMASAMTHPVALVLAPARPCSSPFRFQKEARADTLGFLTKWAELGGVARYSRAYSSRTW